MAELRFDAKALVIDEKPRFPSQACAVSEETDDTWPLLHRSGLGEQERSLRQDHKLRDRGGWV